MNNNHPSLFDEDIPYTTLDENTLSPQQKKDNWEIGIGLQATDGLSASHYLMSLANEHINGTITYKEAQASLNTYYRLKKSEPRQEEADVVAVRIAEILSQTSFSLNPHTYQNYHKQLFFGIADVDFPTGSYRQVNLAKAEEVLQGESVIYADFRHIAQTLGYDFEEERRKERTYSKMTDKTVVMSVKDFMSRIWQAHPFVEGNTRTTAVFIIKYLRSLGFEVTNEPFHKHAKFFRDALVLDNAPRRMRRSVFLEQFMENLCLAGEHPLDRHEMLADVTPSTRPPSKQTHP